MQVHPLAVHIEDHDRLDGAVDGAEPVRRPRRKLHGLTGFDGEIPFAEDQPELAGQHVHPVLALVHGNSAGGLLRLALTRTLYVCRPPVGPLRVNGQ